MNNYQEQHSLANQKLNTYAQNGDALASSKAPSFVFGAISAACSLSLPILLWDSPMAEFISPIICMVCAACILMCTKRIIFSIIAIAIASLFISMTGSTMMCILIFAPICSIASGSVAISRKRGGTLSAFMIALLSFALSFLTTGEPILALLSLVPLPCTIALGICNRKKISKTNATIVGTVFMTISSIAVILLAVATEYGAINVDTIRNAASDLGYTLSYYTEQRIIAMGNDITPEIRLSLLELIDSLINTLPGTVVATAFTVSYICQSMSLAASEKIGENVSQRNYMSASLVTSLVFIGAYLFSFTTNPSGNAALAAVVASNIAFMLTPCLLIVGIKAMRVIPFKLGLLGLLIVIAIVIIMFLPFSSALTVMALTGAFFIVVESIDEWAKEHYSKGENNG